MRAIISKNTFCAVIIAALVLFSACTSECAAIKKRIISLTPASTEILFALGLDEEIIGVSTYCSRPGKAKEKERVGSFSSPNIEKIISLKPDLVILTGMEQQYLKDILLKLNVSIAFRITFKDTDTFNSLINPFNISSVSSCKFS